MASFHHPQGKTAHSQVKAKWGQCEGKVGALLHCEINHTHTYSFLPFAPSPSPARLPFLGSGFMCTVVEMGAMAFPLAHHLRIVPLWITFLLYAF
jgi:hypothetical protein